MIHNGGMRNSNLSRIVGNSIYRQSMYNFSDGAPPSGPIVGIDLGTTNSAVAVFEQTGARIIENAEGGRTTPSMVAFTKSKGGNMEKLVGMAAKRQAVTNPKSTFYAVKRLIGRRYDDGPTQDIKKNLSYEVVKGDNGDAWVYCDNTKKKYSPSQIGSFVLQKMRETAESYIGQNVKDAIITVPAYFNDSQRQATKDAGTIAGLHVKRVINEPTAAALAYGIGSADASTKEASTKKDGTVAVYDLGGGTFDISILHLSDGVFEVMATNGDTALGGEDFDHELLSYICNEFKKEQGIDLMKDPLAVQRLKEAAEKAKKELDAQSSTQLSTPFITADVSGPKHLDMELTRAKLESLCDKLIQRTLKPCEQCLKDADVSKSDISDVILVGGMTRMPAVQKFVEKIFNKTPSKSVNPDEVVALGAAIQAGVMHGKFTGVILVDVTPLSLGIETLGGVFTRLIEKNTKIPAKMSEVFSTASDNQTQVGIKVYQGEREMAADNKFLGHFDLMNIPPAPRGRPQIEVTFDIDVSGILHVSAKDKGTNKDQSMRIETSGGLSKEDIERMKQEAEMHAEDDKKKKESAEVKNSADTLIWQSESQLEEHKDKIDDELRDEVKSAVDKVRELRNNDASDSDELKSAMEDLNKKLSKIGEKIYGNTNSQETNDQSNDQSNENENQNDNNNGNDGSSNDETREAEYKEKSN